MATLTVQRLDYETNSDDLAVLETQTVEITTGLQGPKGDTGDAGPNSISAATLSSLASGSLFASTGSHVAPVVIGPSAGISLVGNFPLSEYSLFNSDKGSDAVATHVAASDPHPQYTTETEVTTALSGYALTSAVPGLAPVQSVAGRTGAVTIAAADVTDSTATGRAVLTAASQAAARTAIGAGIGDAVTSGTLAQFAATTSAQLAGVLSDETGTGSAVFAASPTFTGTVVLSGVTTNLGAAAQAHALQQVAPASGAGNSVTLAASAAASGNTNGGSVVLQPGAKSGSGADGAVVVRQPGGTPGTDEMQASYASGQMRIANPKTNGSWLLTVSGATSTGRLEATGGVVIDDAGGSSRTYIAGGQIRCASGGFVGFSTNSTNAGTTTDAGFTRSAAATLKTTDAAGGGTVSMIVTGLLIIGTYTVATLPSAASNAGALAQVTDANSTTNGTTVAGGGSNRVPVFSNGTNWIIK